MNPKDIDALLKYSFPFTFAMFSLNFSAISACSNALLKYKELHQSKNVEIVVQEMKENMMAMLLGIICVFIVSILKSAIDNQFLRLFVMRSFCSAYYVLAFDRGYSNGIF